MDARMDASTREMILVLDLNNFGVLVLEIYNPYAKMIRQHLNARMATCSILHQMQNSAIEHMGRQECVTGVIQIVLLKEKKFAIMIRAAMECRLTPDGLPVQNQSSFVQTRILFTKLGKTGMST